MAIKYHFLQQFIGNDICILKVDTKEQLANLCTKGLPLDVYCELTSKLMAWTQVIFQEFPRILAKKILVQNLIIQLRGSGMS